MTSTPETHDRDLLLSLRDLSVGFDEPAAGEAVAAGEGPLPEAGAVVRGVCFGIRPGEILALVGESGSGKTMTALAILGLLPPGGRILSGSVHLRGAGDLARSSRSEWRRLRGRRIAMIFQDPMSALNPVLTIGYQIVEVLRLHRRLTRRRALAEALRLLELVAMPDAGRRLASYPHQLSGGQLQRAMIAMALACQPDVLLADEPTTALDVTIQAQILDLLEDLRQRLGVAILLITHDFGVVAEIADRVAVMYEGQIVEQAPVKDLYARPTHPYTRQLIAAVAAPGVPRPEPAGVEDRPSEAMPARDPNPRAPLLEVRGLAKSFEWKRPFGAGGPSSLRAIDGIDLDVRRGECLAIVGESGSGKTTLARSMLRLLEPDQGTLRFDGEDLRALSRRPLARWRRRFQMVFQDSAGALDPRMRVVDALAEPLRIHRLLPKHEIARRVDSLLATVRLPAPLGSRYPHQLSGGQRQRVAIARALATGPELLVLDEPVSALDVSVRTGILHLLDDLRRRLALTLVFIAHDLTMVEQRADRIAVLYLGRLIETGSCREVFAEPRHPYTASLLAAVPRPDPELANRRRERSAVTVLGDLPSALSPPPGCPFHPRCAIYRQLADADSRRCRELRPGLGPIGEARSAACHFPLATPETAM